MEKKAVEEILHSLNEWGLSDSLEEHKEFRKLVVSEILASLKRRSSGQSFDYKELQHDKFPVELDKAYEHVLSHEQVPDDVYSVRDKLNMEGYGNPYRRRYIKRLDQVKGYSLRPEYRTFTKRDLDPLHRYEYQLMEQTELIFLRWFCEVEDCHLGIFYEAALACHALQYEVCYNCKFRNSLRWNGGSQGSWQDMICTKCGCIYEIKTKASMEKVEKAFMFNSIPGGSYSSFCKMNNSKRPDQKIFLVLLPRSWTCNRKGEEVYPVQIAEIAYVLPQVNEHTFNQHRWKKFGKMHFRSKISVKLQSKSKWFDLPSFGSLTFMDGIRKQVFQSRFSEERYHHFMHQYIAEDDKESNESKSVDSIDKITSGLKSLEVTPDNWEDLLSDSD